VKRTGRLGLGPVDQVSFVVEDLERALPRYEALYGPFEVGVAPLRDCRFRNERVSCTLKVAVNRAGPLEIELIQVLDGKAPHSEHLRAHGEGLHHVRFRVEALDAKLAELEREGYTTVFYKRFGPTVAFAYLETPPEIGRSVIELLEMP
jgi:hypothetical protein